MSRNVLFALSLVFTAALVRLFPHPDNFTPLGAMGLFGAAYLRRSWGLAVPFLALFLSDLVLNNVVYRVYFPEFTWFTSIWSYVAMAGVVATGALLLNGKINVARIATASVAGSLVFFLISNYATFDGTNLYPKTPAGLMACYTAGLPFLQNTILGDLFFSAVLFGAYAYFNQKSLATLPLDK